MTPEERRKKFLDAYNALVQQYGYQLEPAATDVPPSGMIHIGQMALSVRAVPGWKPPPDVPDNAKTEDEPP